MNGIKHVWAEGSMMQGDAEVAAGVCAELESKGVFSAEMLVEVSRDKDAPLHGMFEWDDSIAAEKYRVQQAGKIIRSIVVVGDNKPVAYRAFSSIGSKAYMSTARAVSSEKTRAILLKSAKNDLVAFRRRYQALSELAEVFDVIDKVTSCDIRAII